MAKLSLLEQAKQVKMVSPRHYSFTDEELSLFVAWVKGELNKVQVSKVLNISLKGTQFCTSASLALREAFRRGLLK